MKKAKFIKDVSEKFTGSAALYEVTPEIEYDYDSKTKKNLKSKYVVVSATNVPLSGEETYIFVADENGRVLDWGELDGSYRGGLNKEYALNGAGYEVI